MERCDSKDDINVRHYSVFMIPSPKTKVSHYEVELYIVQWAGGKVSKAWLINWLYSISFYFPSQMYPSTESTYSFHSDFSSICQNNFQINYFVALGLLRNENDMT
jgi:hypothetical protein